MFISILVLAEKWGCPPWVVVGEEPTETIRQQWYQRGVFYYSQINIREENKIKELQNV
jgi:hypothetical protein